MIFQHLETDLKKIAHLSKKRERENTDFRMFLKGEDSSNVDKIVHRLNKEISNRIDCTACGNCCKHLHPALTESEIESLSALKSISVELFKKKYIEEDCIEKEQYFKFIPCIFLDDKICSIYQQRPETCRSYPNLHKSDFTSRSMTALINYEICPIVFNVLEEMKRELNYRF